MNSLNYIHNKLVAFGIESQKQEELRISKAVQLARSEPKVIYPSLWKELKSVKTDLFSLPKIIYKEYEIVNIEAEKAWGDDAGFVQFLWSTLPEKYKKMFRFLCFQ